MLRSLAALPARRRALLAAAAAWVVAARAALLVPRGSLPKLERGLDRLAARLPAPPPFTADEAVWAVTAAARRLPGTRCLAWSLALRGLLARAGLPCDLRLGVRAAGPGAIEAHAFVEHAGRALSWGDADGYRVLRPRGAGP